MENTIPLRLHTEYQYHTTAKQLYHVALYAVGDTALAEQTAAGAFSDALKRMGDTSDITLLERQCYRLLYRYGKKSGPTSVYGSCHPGEALSEELKCAGIRGHMSALLTGLDFNERFIVLLFCLKKYTVRQIAGITRLPRFLIEKRLVAAVGKAIR